MSGAGIKLFFKDSVNKSDIPDIAGSHELVVLGEATGPTTAEMFAASGNHPGLYQKSSGIKPDDPLWNVAQPLLWRDSAGNIVWHMDKKWAFLDVQNRAVEVAQKIFLPKIAAQLSEAGAGVYGWVFWDNIGFQDRSLFFGGPPDNFDAAKYHAGTLAVVREGKAAFPNLRTIVNGLNGGAPEGLRGEAYKTEAAVDAVYCESFWWKASPPVRPNTHFGYDQQLVIDLANSGKRIIIDEPATQYFSAEWMQAWGVALTTAGKSEHRENFYFNISAPPFKADLWWR